MADSLRKVVKNIRIESINTDDGSLQQRERINDGTVADYAEAMRCGAKFPPVTLFFDGTQYWLADGFHRFCASKDAEMLDILSDVRDGTKRDAKLFSASANGTHGQRLTNEDKRKSVLVLLLDKEWSEWSNRDIAKHCHVTHTMVNKLREELSHKVEAVSTSACKPNNDAGVDFQNSTNTLKKEAVNNNKNDDSGGFVTEAPSDADEKSMMIDSLDTLIEDLHAQVDDLKNQIASGGSTEYKARLNELSEENRKLHILNNGLIKGRDAQMNENASLKRQCQIYLRKLKATEK